jgi:dihydroxy-acid dehydratase
VASGEANAFFEPGPVVSADAPRRSRGYLDARSPGALVARGFLKVAGLTEADLDRPLIGVCNTWSDLNPCHGHFKALAAAVKHGIVQARGTPLEFNALSVHENLTAMHSTSLMYRNFLAMEVEELLRSQPLDAAVLLGGCDKTIPALLMGAASADIPCVVLAGGPSAPGRVRGQRVGCWSITPAWHSVRSGDEDPGLLDDLVTCMNGSFGTCDIMGTASTMASACEALGMSLPGSAVIPAVDPRREHVARDSGVYAVEACRRDLRPSTIMTAEAFDNAIRVVHALGGSTNAVIHLIAVARRLGIPLSLDRFDELSRTTPFLGNVAPSGEFWMEEFSAAGGVPAVMRELLPLLHGDAITVSGRSVRDNVERAAVLDRKVIAPLEMPLAPEGGLAVVRGSLAPDGAIIKVSAATPELLRHRGRALVFDSREALLAAVVDETLDVLPSDVLVLRNQGPIGYPGMPHSGDLPIPAKLRRQGVRDMVRISDATISGTRGGTLVVHVAPEAALGGPLALVRTGDIIELDVPRRQLNLVVSHEELTRRRAAWQSPAAKARRGYGWLYVRHVLQANDGCDFDFLGPNGI